MPNRAWIPCRSLESFFSNSAFSSALLSPNGKHLAVTISPKGRRDSLFVIDLLADGGKLVAQFNDTDIDDVQWVNNERLIFDTRDRGLGQRDVHEGPGLFAVNRDGSGLRQLVEFGGEKDWYRQTSKQDKNLLPYNTYMLSQRGAQNSEYVYVTSPVWDADGTRLVNLLRLDTITGRATQVKRPPDVKGWLLDNRGEPRVAFGWDKKVAHVYYRPTASGEWTSINEGNPYHRKGGTFRPLAFGPGDTLFVATNHKRDTEAIFSFDYTTGKLTDAPLIETAGYDFKGSLITREGKLLGMRFSTDATSNMWFDDKMKALQERIDGVLKTTVNLISVAARSETPWVVVTSYSDLQPVFFNLFNTETGVLRKVGDSRPDINPSQMGRQQQVTYKSRDGLTIPALLTLPKGKSKNLPLVLLIHGGPYVRGSMWGWDAESQFLASRGYAVLEPSFRGTTGFGEKHYKAGFKQWGLGMQDDMADGVQWAIDKGIVDAKRVCIAGASYGGYATLMGLIKHNAMYKCGINWLGVSDIELMAKGHWSFKSDMSSDWLNYGMPEIIGDVVKDADQLKATSPLVHAKKVTQPLLMAYGGADRRVPIYHGNKFMAAVKATNPNVEMVVYPEEGHGWALAKNRYDFYGRVEKFLEQHIGR